MLVVFQQRVVLERDVRIGREQQADVDVAAVQRRNGQRTTRVKRLEVLELQVVDAHQTRQTERPLGTLWRTAEHQLAGDRLEVAHLGQLVLVRRGLGYHEPVRVDRLGEVEHGDVHRRQEILQRLLRGSGIRASLCLVLGQEGFGRSQVLRDEVDLTRLERRLDDLTRA